MHLTDEEKKERARLAAKRYREKLKEKAKNDPAFKEKIKKDGYIRRLSSAKAFLRLHIKAEDLKEIKEVIKEREEKLKKKK